MSQQESLSSLPNDPFGHQRSRGKGCVALIVLLIVGAIFAGVFSCGGLLVYIAYYGLPGSEEAPPFSFPNDDQSLEDKRKEITTAFASKEIGVTDAELLGIQQLFDSVIAATSQENLTAFLATVDIDRLFKQAERSQYAPDLMFLQTAMYKATIEDSFALPAYWERYVIKRVELSEDGRDALAYTYFWDTDHCWSVRWWISRSGNRWKVYDWEMLEDAMRETTTWALYMQYGDNWQLQQYYSLFEDINEADDLIAEGDYEGAAEKILKAEDRKVHPIVKNDAQQRIGYVWLRCGNLQRALDATQLITPPESVPGTFIIRATVYDQLGQHEKAVEAAETYETLVGSGPDILDQKADSLRSLGRIDEAMAALRTILEIDPNNISALESYGLLLDEENKPEIAVFVSKMANAATAAETLAGHFFSFDDTSAVEAVADGLRLIDPQASVIHYIDALALESAERYEEAAAAYRLAFQAEKDAESKSLYVDYFLEAMLMADKLVEGYQQAPDAENAFYTLTDYYDDGDYDITNGQLKDLVDAHRQKFPDDPWLAVYTCLLLGSEEKYEEVTRILEEAISKTEDETVMSSLQFYQVEALVELDRVIDAYEARGNNEESFEAVGNYCRWNGHMPKLEALIERHREQFPDDPKIGFFTAVFLKSEGELAKANRLFSQAYMSTEDENLKSNCRTEWIDSLFQLGTPLAAYEQIEPRDETFESLVYRLKNEENWSDLESLIELHKRNALNDAVLLDAQVELHWRRGEYEQIIALMSPLLDQRMQALGDTTITQMRERVVRSYLRLKKLDEALALAQLIYDEEQEPHFLAVVNAALGYPDETSKFLDEYSQSSYYRTDIYDDEDVGDIARSDEFLPCRKAHPPGIRSNANTFDIVLLLKDDIDLPEQSVRATAATVFGADPSVNAISKQDADKSARSFVLNSGSTYGYISAGTGKFSNEMDELKLGDKSLEQKLADHSGWLAINLKLPKIGSDSVVQEACRLASGFLNDNCIAVYFASINRLVPNDDNLRETLSEIRAKDALEEIGESAWLYYAGFDDARASSHSLRQLASSFRRRKSGQEFSIKVRLSFGHAEETHWLRLVRIKYGQYEPSNWIGEFTDSSTLMPRFETGEPAMLSGYDIVEWKSSDGDQ